MNTAFGLGWLRIDLRRRWRSLVVLALLIAFATATVLASMAGALRGATALDRLGESTFPSHLMVLPNDPRFDWEEVRGLPEVEAVAEFPISGLTVDGIPPEDNVVSFPSGGPDVMRTIERPVVIDGRMADLSRADQVMVTPAFAKTYGLGVGDPLTLRLYKPETADETWGSWYSGEGDGPAVQTTIVGVARSLWFGDHVGGNGQVVPTPALLATYPRNLLGGGEVIPVNALVRLRDGDASVPAFRADLARLSGRNDIDVQVASKQQERGQKTNDFESACLAAFGLAALLAAGFLIGSAIARYTSASVADLQTLRATGLTRGQGAFAASLAPTIAAVAGATLGVAGAIAASPLMPIGAAATVEPSPGFDADWRVLAPGWLLAIACVLAGAIVSVFVALAPGLSEVPRPKSAIARTAAQVGVPIAVVVGARFALEPGRGRSAVPVRPAVLGAVAGVLGVLTALTFASGVSDAASNPLRFGVTYERVGVLGLGADVAAPPDAVLASWAKDPEVVGLVDTRIAVAESTDISVTLFSYKPVKGTVNTVLTEGRMPRSADEVVLAPESARAAGASVGSSIQLTGSTHKRRTLTVAGIGFVPEGAHNDYADGGWVTAAGYRALFGDVSKYHCAMVDLRDGVDADLVSERLQTNAGAAVEGGENAGLEPPSIPYQVALIREVQVLPFVLGGFLAVLAMGAVGHALATAVRHRRHDVAVLRALGMTPGQSRAVVVTQASVLALIGGLVGLPLGFALGRTLWRVVADLMPLAYHPPVVLVAMLLSVPVAVLIANLLAAWPGHRAARLHVGQVLRAE